MAAAVAVTGATGFIGSAVVRRLLADGRVVRCLVPSNVDERNLAGLDVERVPCDVTESRQLERALAGCETLYHLAALYKTWLPEREVIYRVNLEGTTATLLAAQKMNVKRIVFTSSIAAVGLVDGGEADETCAWNLHDVANDYIWTKWLSERVALRFAESGMSLVVVNPAFPFGPGDIAPTPTGKIVLGVLRGQIPGVLPGGICTIDVDDCAAGHVHAEEKGKSGERYILGGDNVSLKDLFALIGHVSGTRAPWLPLPGAVSASVALGMELWADHVSHKEPDATYRSMRYAMKHAFFSNAKAKRELGLSTRPLEETVRRSVRWFYDQGMVQRSA